MLVSKPTSGLSLCARMVRVGSRRKIVRGSGDGSSSFVRVLVVNVFDSFEAVLRIPARAAAFDRGIRVRVRHRTEATARVKKFYEG